VSPESAFPDPRGIIKIDYGFAHLNPHARIHMPGSACPDPRGITKFLFGSARPNPHERIRTASQGK
jgi:hypothetical protein